MQSTDRAPARLHSVSDHLVDLLGDLAALSTHEETTTAVPGLLQRLADQTGAAACQLDTAVTGDAESTQAAFQTVACVGYPEPVSQHLSGEFTTSRHGRLVLEANAGLRIAVGDPYDFRSSEHYHDVLHPAGFDDGISLALRDSGLRPVGLLHLSASTSRDFAPELAGALAALGRAFARITRVASYSVPDVALPGDYAVVRLDERGTATPVVGRAPLHLELDEPLRTIIRGVLATGMQFATFLHQQHGRLVEVRVHSPGGHPTSRQPCTVATRPAESTLGLTLRQLEVLTAVATGAGNREIADELCLTQRTVAAHMEAILTRLGTPSRAGAAAKATAAGILLPSSDPASVRSLARILRRPVA